MNNRSLYYVVIITFGFKIDISIRPFSSKHFIQNNGERINISFLSASDWGVRIS